MDGVFYRIDGRKTEDTGYSLVTCSLKYDVMQDRCAHATGTVDSGSDPGLAPA